MAVETLFIDLRLIKIVDGTRRLLANHSKGQQALFHSFACPEKQENLLRHHSFTRVPPLPDFIFASSSPLCS